ncbi:MAG: helix-turn-helix domain-containing protein [Cyanobacteria bacterium SBLK]|nr:helix-turn-helix domain-containing protein [Cyanobacteria bacterium SBLK]
MSTNSSLQSVGSKENLSHLSFTIILATKDGHFCSHGHPLNLQTDLSGFDMQREVHFITPPEGIMAHIFVPTQLFQTCASQLQRDDLGDRFLATNYATLLPDRMGQLKAYLQELFRVVQHKPGWLQQPHIAKLVAEDFVPLLVRSIPLQGKAKPALKLFRRAPLVVRAEKEMTNCLEQPLTLKELARRLGSSSSALSYGFKDIFGMSSMRYLKVRRLNAVRRYLKAGDPGRHTVETFANQFGFWNSGHFAKDYKTLFGELPSETLQTPTKHLNVTNWEIIETDTLQNEL